LSWYIDSSAILKLIFTEKETLALDKVMNNKMVTSTLTRVEVKRAVNRINSTKSKVDVVESEVKQANKTIDNMNSNCTIF